ncbi:MAG: hypothetical protein JXQ73_19070 [Phycisphaerae bacterium]|nr:hypothetical protein [Phycisphaerae bacterium]
MSGEPSRPGKVCRICGQDCSGRPRTKDRKGNYYCKACYDRAVKERSAAKLAAATARPHQVRQAEASAEPASEPAVTEEQFHEESTSESPLLTELSAFEQSGEPVDVEQGRCTHCGSPMPGGAILCTRCGYNVQTGKQAEVGVGPLDADKPKATAVAVLGKGFKAAGSFLLGCVLSGTFALVGAALWCVLAIVTGREFGLVAWGIGLAAGFGMVLGFRDRNPLAGIVAAGISVFGITVGKIAIFVFVIYAIATGNTSSTDLQKAILVLSMTEDALDEHGITDQAERKAKWDATAEEARKRVDRMNKAQLEAEWQKYQAKVEAKRRTEALAAVMAEAGEEAATTQEAGDAGKPTTRAARASPRRVLAEELDEKEDMEEDPEGEELFRDFLKFSFGGMDILFILLAIASAYKLASGHGAQD